MTARTEISAGCPRSDIDPFCDEFLADPFGYLAQLRETGLLRALAARVGSWHLAGEPRPRLNNTLRGLGTLPARVDPA
jgi:hypothetical protein